MFLSLLLHMGIDLRDGFSARDVDLKVSLVCLLWPSLLMEVMMQSGGAGEGELGQTRELHVCVCKVWWSGEDTVYMMQNL